MRKSKENLKIVIIIAIFSIFLLVLLIVYTKHISSQPAYATNDSTPPLYVGTLIADERGLKELERKMRIIQLKEDRRRS